MHELSLMQSIIEIVLDELKAHGRPQVEVVRVKVGELAGVEEMSMQFAFEVLKEEEEVLKDARLELIYVPGEAYCAKCDLRYPVKRYRVLCPQCGGGGRIVAGKELFVDSLEVEDNGD